MANIEGLTDAETNADDVQRTKPHPDVFEVALKKIGAEANETIAFGDSPFDAEAAGKVGLPTVGLLCGGFPEEVLRAAGATAIYRDPADLLAHLNEIVSLNDPTKKEEKQYA
jgi:phosphoglycolate phosphatase-like HAD superfamily hydrolase